MRRAKQIGGHVEIDGRHEIARPECHPVERGAVTARDRGIRRRVEDLLRHVLVLEHVENLAHIFKEASLLLKIGGHVYIGELHPYKQYAGTKARFEAEQELHVLKCYNHNISEFTQAAKEFKLVPEDVDEYFDDEDRTALPRILTIVFKKTQ